MATNEVCDSVEKLVIHNRRIKVREIAVAMGISTGGVQAILHDNVGLLKVFARWVPRMFSVFQRVDRVDIFRANLNLFSSDSEDFCFCVVTGDETWFHHYDSETKQLVDEMKTQGLLHPRNFRFRLQSAMSCDNFPGCEHNNSH